MTAKIASTRIFVAALAILSGFAGSADAAKLDEPACTGLKAERARLATDAIKSDMAKGPQWGKENLSSERLKEIEQLIGIEENIAFRCPVPKPPPVPVTCTLPPLDVMEALILLELYTETP